LRALNACSSAATLIRSAPFSRSQPGSSATLPRAQWSATKPVQIDVLAGHWNRAEAPPIGL
jgi:hypothetical protein